ncbi:hypothetical protein B0H13DRAFT_2003384 [Mycena leptocephala]|nr:hypothetical protein B0H13DRAFT_2003384 [Mycena leptocephala]
MMSAMTPPMATPMMPPTLCAKGAPPPPPLVPSVPAEVDITVMVEPVADTTTVERKTDAVAVTVCALEEDADRDVRGGNEVAREELDADEDEADRDVEAEDVEAELLATEDDALSERLDDALAELEADSWRGRLRRLRIPHRTVDQKIIETQTPPRAASVRAAREVFG